jgi:hypothetical protein
VVVEEVEVVDMEVVEVEVEVVEVDARHCHAAGGGLVLLQLYWFSLVPGTQMPAEE